MKVRGESIPDVRAERRERVFVLTGRGARSFLNISDRERHMTTEGLQPASPRVVRPYPVPRPLNYLSKGDTIRVD